MLQIIIDGTGMSPSAKGDYIRCKYKIKTRSGFIRLSVMIQQDTMQVLGFTVTDEKIGDSPQFEPLIKQTLKSMGIDPDVRRAAVMEAGTGPPPDHIAIEIRADARYDSRENFQTCKEYGITPIIKIRRNAEYKAKGVSRERGMQRLTSWVAALQTSPNFTTWTSRNVRKTKMSGKNTQNMVHDGRWRYSSRHSRGYLEVR